MAIRPGDTIPDAILTRMGEDAPEQLNASELFAGKKVVRFFY